MSGRDRPLLAAAAIVLAGMLALIVASHTAKTGGSELIAERDRLLAERVRLGNELRLHTRERLVPPEDLSARADVVAAVPSEAIEEVLSRALTEGINGLELRVRNVKVHVEKQVRTRLLLLKTTVGTFDLDVLLRDVQGSIASGGPPEVSVGQGRISVDARVKVQKGVGKTQLRFRWNAKGVAGAVCPDLDVTRELEGALVPLTFHLRGSVAFRLEGSALVIDPSWPDQTFRLRLRPSIDAWKAVLQLIDEQPGACRVALRTANVVGSLRELVEKGFVVHVHTARLKTARVPLELTGTVPFERGQLQFTASPTMLSLDERYVWVGSRFAVSRTR